MHPPLVASPCAIRTKRLRLVAATPELIDAALAGDGELARRLGARLPPAWPPEFHDREALECIRELLLQHGADRSLVFYFVACPPAVHAPTLVGFGGYRGPPSAGGEMEVGYSIVAGQRGKGYATEAVAALVARAFGSGAAVRVVAEVEAKNRPSMRVLRRNGFHPAGFTGIGERLRFECHPQHAAPRGPSTTAPPVVWLSRPAVRPEYP